MATSKTKQAVNILDTYKFITIEPFSNPDKYNGGYEKMGCSGAPEAPLDLPIAATDQTGTSRILSGLDQKAYEVIRIKDEDERNAKISEIVTTIKFLETQFGLDSKIIDPTNFNFWLHDDMRIKIRRGEGLTFDIKSNYRDILKVLAIQAGGYPEIAPSFQEAVARSAVNKKVTHYLYKKEEVDDIKATPAVEKALLISKFANLYEQDPGSLFYIAIILLPSSKSYRNKTAPKIIFRDCISYVDGEEGVKTNNRKRFDEIRKVLEMGTEELIVRSVAKIAEYLRFIRKAKEGDYSDVSTGEFLGKSNESVVEYLKNPIHLDVYSTIKNRVDEYWGNG